MSGVIKFEQNEPGEAYCVNCASQKCDLDHIEELEAILKLLYMPEYGVTLLATDLISPHRGKNFQGDGA